VVARVYEIPAALHSIYTELERRGEIAAVERGPNAGDAG
jgi:hypothetical protein